MNEKMCRIPRNGRMMKKCVKNMHDGMGAYFRYCTLYVFTLRVRGYHFEYDTVSLVDLFTDGLIEEVNLFEGRLKARACS